MHAPSPASKPAAHHASPPTHPHGTPGKSQPTTAQPLPLHPVIKNAVPRWVYGVCIALAWLRAASLTLLFLTLATLIMDYSQGVSPSTNNWVTLVVLGVITAACGAATTFIGQYYSSRCVHLLRQEILTTLTAVNRPLTKDTVGSYLNLLMQAVEKTAGLRAVFYGPIIGNVTSPLAVLLVIGITTDPLIALVLGLLLITVPLAVAAFRRASQPVGQAYRAAQAALTAEFLEAIGALEMLIYANAARSRGNNLAARGQDLRRQVMRLLKVNQLLILLVDGVFFLATVVAACLLVWWRASTTDLTPAAALTVILATTVMVAPIDTMGQFFYIGLAGQGTQKAINGLLTRLGKKPQRTEAPSTTSEHSSTQPQPQPQNFPELTALALNNVAIGYENQKPLATSINATCTPGTITGVIGRSGAGKTTLLTALADGSTLRAGQILLTTKDGDTLPFDPAQHSQLISLVDQTTFLFNASIRDNLTTIAPYATDDEIHQALSRAGLSDDIAQLPQGLDTPVGANGAMISSGQAQRLSLARAWLSRRPIMLLDEPTANVDIAGEKLIVDALTRIATDTIVIVLTHRPHTIAACGNIIDLNPKRPAETTSHPQQEVSN